MIVTGVELIRKGGICFRLLNSEIGNDQTELVMNEVETSKFSSP